MTDWSDERRARHAATWAAKRLAKWGTADLAQGKLAGQRAWRAKHRQPTLRDRVAALEGRVGQLMERISALEQRDRRIVDGGTHTRRRRSRDAA